MRVLPSGDAGVLLECADLAEVLALYDRIVADPPDGLVDVVPAGRTVLVALDPAQTTAERVGGALAAWEPVGARTGASAHPVLEIAVHYDGADLDDVAELLGCDPDEVIARHTSSLWTVAFCGFAPGFGYLTADHGGWDIPRRATPRTKVPPGSVGLAGEFSGIYPRESPGGWQLIGRTEVPIFDLDRDPPALLTPGTRVRFVEAKP